MHMKIVFAILAMLFCMFAVSQNVVQFKESLFWKGDISIVPHALYHGCGLAPNGSFFLGDSGRLVKVNLPSGKKEIIVKATHPEEYAWASVVSPDSSKIAYSWFNGDFFDLMVVDNVASPSINGIKKLLVKGSNGMTATPYDWSPDGKWILASLIDTNWIARIAIISPIDGSVKILKDVGKQLFDKISFSPDGKQIAYNYHQNGSSNLWIMNSDGTSDAPLWIDSSYKVAPYWSTDGKRIIYLARNKDSFNLFFVPVSNGKTTGNPVLIKNNIGFFSPLGFIKDGSFLYGTSFYGTASTVPLDVYQAELDKTTQNIASPIKLISSRFPGLNSDAILSPDGKRLAYKSNRGGSAQVIVIRQNDQERETDLVKESGTLSQWFPDNRSILVYRMLENGMCSVFRINSDNGRTDSISILKSDYGNLRYKHDPILSANGNLVYYIEGNRGSNSSQIFALDLRSKQERKVATINSSDITSFSASPDGKYLSMIVLYQQQRGRPCAITLVDLSSGKKRELFRSPWGDATKFFGLAWSHDSKYIYHVRSDTVTSSSLVWRISSSGGKPQKTGLTMIDLRMPQIHPNGKHVFFHGGRGWYNQTYEIRSIKISQ